jgi:cysteine-rich repeat protein
MKLYPAMVLGNTAKIIFFFSLLACPSAYSPLDDGPPLGSSSSTTETHHECGDGAIQPPEECDDANSDNTDECTNKCTLAICGDGIIGLEEGCDDANDDNHDACTNACTIAMCGDSIVGPNEECDDANDDETDSCTSACTFVTCGDGSKDFDEECDNGIANADDAECTSECKNAFCGDGLVYADTEECDGSGNETATCNANCTNAECGDGILNTTAGEECDDGNLSSSDDCTATCKPATCGDGIVHLDVEECDAQSLGDPTVECCRDCERCRYVFATSQTYYGNLVSPSGYSGAVSICISSAANAGLANPELYKAWLSDDNGAANSRLDTSFQGAYVRTDGEIVAEGWNDLTDGLLKNPISVDEFGQPIPYSIVWSATSYSGTQATSNPCADFKSSSNTYSAGGGAAYDISSDWTYTSSFACSDKNGLYCFEDLP